MKKLYTFTTALLMLAGTFTSCTKDLDDVAMTAALSQDAKGGKIVSTNQKTDGGLLLTFSKLNPVVGEEITITASFAETVTAGTLRIDKLDADGVNWSTVSTSALSASVTSVSHTFTSSTAGSHTFRGFYTPTGQSNFSQAQTIPATVTFTATCTGANLTAELVSQTEVENGLTEYKVAFTLTSCTAYSNVKLKGGISATITGDVVAMSADGVAGNIDYNNRNATVSWDNLNLTEGYSNTFYVTFRMADDNKDEPIGDWTAKVGDKLIAEATL